MGKNFKNRYATIANFMDAVAFFYTISVDFDTNRRNITTILQQFLKSLYDSVIQQSQNCRYCHAMEPRNSASWITYVYTTSVHTYKFFTLRPVHTRVVYHAVTTSRGLKTACGQIEHIEINYDTHTNADRIRSDWTFDHGVSGLLLVIRNTRS